MGRKRKPRTCPHCGKGQQWFKKHGFYGNSQRYYCKWCQRTFTGVSPDPLKDYRVAETVREMSRRGVTIAQISWMLNLHQSFVFRILKQQRLPLDDYILQELEKIAKGE